MKQFRLILAMAAAAALAGSAVAQAPRPWMDTRLSPERRADLVLDQMTLDEQIALLHGSVPGMVAGGPPPGSLSSAGFVPGNARLGIPALTESDASLGVAAAGRQNDEATPLPSGLALASTWSEDQAFRSGGMIGKEARSKGFNVLLAGGVNLVREPRGGRNFEYLGEDPLLAGTLAGASIRGIQSNHIVSTVKHYALNSQETGRMAISAEIEPAAFRESDLLAFQIAIEKGQPGSVMCAYNRIGGIYACEHPELLTNVLKRDWAYPGWVMSDWGAVHSLGAANAGLDQESGQEMDAQVFFGAPLKSAVLNGQIFAVKVRDMARRILRGMFANGLFDDPVKAAPLDLAANGAVARATAEQGIVLLKNEGGLLPLSPAVRKVAVIGNHSDYGVLSGGGSSQVIPKGSGRLQAEPGAESWIAGVIYHPSSPLAAIRLRAPQVEYNDGADIAAAANLARQADVAIVFGGQWTTEGSDAQLFLSGTQDALIAAVAAANPKTIVVLETGGPIMMPWLGAVPAVVEAWYPGAQGGEAIARVLYGEVNPSGRLPVSFPASVFQLPNPSLPNGPTARYEEGSDVGYRWYARNGMTPLFPFGHGLSYTSFRYSNLDLSGGDTLKATFRVTNTGTREGIDTPQVYLVSSPTRRQQRLIGWSRVSLKPGESRQVSVTADPRLLGNWDEAARRWRVEAGDYRVALATDATALGPPVTASLKARILAP